MNGNIDKACTFVRVPLYACHSIHHHQWGHLRVVKESIFPQLHRAPSIHLWYLLAKWHNNYILMLAENIMQILSKQTNCRYTATHNSPKKIHSFRFKRPPDVCTFLAHFTFHSEFVQINLIHALFFSTTAHSKTPRIFTEFCVSTSFLFFLFWFPRGNTFCAQSQVTTFTPRSNFLHCALLLDFSWHSVSFQQIFPHKVGINELLLSGSGFIFPHHFHPILRQYWTILF